MIYCCLVASESISKVVGEIELEWLISDLIFVTSYRRTETVLYPNLKFDNSFLYNNFMFEVSKKVILKFFKNFASSCLWQEIHTTYLHMINTNFFRECVEINSLQSKEASSKSVE